MRFGVFIRIVCVALLAGSASLAAPALAKDDIAGRWTGVVAQSDGQTYAAVMEFDASGSGRSDYPSLNCSGKLSGSGKQGAYEFHETIASDTGRAGEAGRCLDGTIRISVSGDAMHWSWSGEWKGTPIVAEGVLTRQH